MRDCARVAQRVVVTLNSIGCDTANDGPFDSTLEVYGLITAQGSGDPQNLYNKGSSGAVSIEEGHTFGSPMISQAVITVSPNAGQAIRLRAHLWDDDSFLGIPSSDDLGDEVSINPFETGWRKNVTITLTSGSGVLKVNLSLAPI